jgi:anti-anti-sigma regulatory factor
MKTTIQLNGRCDDAGLRLPATAASSLEERTKLSPLELLQARRAEAAKLFEGMQAQADNEGYLTITLGIADIHGNNVNALIDRMICLIGGQHQTVTLDCSAISTIDVHAAHALAIRLGAESCLHQVTISGANDEVAEILEEEGFAVA